MEGEVDIQLKEIIKVGEKDFNLKIYFRLMRNYSKILYKANLKVIKKQQKIMVLIRKKINMFMKIWNLISLKKMKCPNFLSNKKLLKKQKELHLIIAKRRKELILMQQHISHLKNLYKDVLKQLKWIKK